MIRPKTKKKLIFIMCSMYVSFKIFFQFGYISTVWAFKLGFFPTNKFQV